MSNEESSEYEKLRRDFERLDASFQEQARENESLLGTLRSMQDKQSHVEQGFGRFTATPSRSEPQVIFVAKEQHISRFQGKPGSEVYLEDWIRDIKSHLHSSHQSADNAILFVTEHLTGPARVEIDGHVDIAYPEDIFIILRRVFSDCGNDQQKRLRLFGRKQETDESLLVYSHELIRLYQHLDNDRHYKEQKDKNLTAIFVEGVRDPLLSRELNRQMLANPDDSFFSLRDWAIDWHKRGSKDSRIRHAIIKEAVGDTGMSHEAHIEEAPSTSLLSVLHRQADMLQEHIKAQHQHNDAVIQLLKRVDNSGLPQEPTWNNTPASVYRSQSFRSRPPFTQVPQPVHFMTQQDRPNTQSHRHRGHCYTCGSNSHFQIDCPRRSHGHSRGSLNE